MPIRRPLLLGVSTMLDTNGEECLAIVRRGPIGLRAPRLYAA
jgi:hypothetical protein